MAFITSLTEEEAASSGFSHKVILAAADVAALTSGTAYSIFPGYAGTSTNTNYLVKDCQVFVKTAFAFSGANNGTLAMVVGDGSTANAYMTSTTLKTAGWIVGALTKPAIPAGDIIKVTITAGTQAITLVNAGEVHIFLSLVDGDEIAA